MHGETSKVTTRHGRRLNGKTKVTDPNGPWKQTDVKQEVDDTAFDCKQELTPQEMEALWLEIKQEIKEEMEAEGCRAGAGEAEHVSWTSVKREVAGEVKIKRELLEERNQDRALHDSQCKQPADPATPKRRRLTRRDLDTPAKQAVETATVKQEWSKQVRVKQEVKTEHALEGGPKLTPFNMRTESDWLEVKQEVNEDATMDGSTVSRAARIKREVTGLALRSSTLKGIAVKQELKDDIGTQSKGLPTLSAVKEEDPGRVELLLEVRSRLGQVGQGFQADTGDCFFGIFCSIACIRAQISRSTASPPFLDRSSARARDSLDAFVAQAATWAKQCLLFRSSKTWTPTRPKRSEIVSWACLTLTGPAALPTSSWTWRMACPKLRQLMRRLACSASLHAACDVCSASTPSTASKLLKSLKRQGVDFWELCCVG